MLRMNSLVKIVKYLILLLLVFVSIAPLPSVMAGLTNCCLPENTLNGVGCSLDGTLYQGDVYYCVEVKELCPYCSIAPDISSAECYQCCAMGVDYCQVGPLSSNSYRMLFLTFLGSCFCCTFLFISAEESRMKEGISFQEAYLIPIPIVPVDIDEGYHSENSTSNENLIVANHPYNVDVPVAEPAEYYSLIRNRNFRYEDDDW